MGVGWSYFELRQFARATDWFRKADKAAKTNVQKSSVMLAIASCMYNLGGFDKSVDYYRKLTQTYPGEEAAQEADFQIAWVYYRQSVFDKALESFNLYLEKYPEGKKKTEAIFFKAWSYYNQLKYPEAIENFKLAYETASIESVFKEKALLDYAKSLGANRQNTEAIGFFHKFLDEFPMSASVEEAYYVLSRTYLEVDKPAGAESSYRDLKNIKNSSTYLNEILRDIGSYYRRNKKYQLADKAYKMIIENSENPEQKLEMSFQRIHMFAEAMNYPEALKICKELLDSNAEELAPFRMKILLETVNLYISSKNIQAALEMIQKEKQRKDPDLLYSRRLDQEEAKIFILLKEFEKSRLLLKPLLEINELSISSRYYMGLGYYNENKNVEAMEFFLQVIQKTDEDYFAAWSFYYLGEIRYSQHEYLTAAREYTKIIYLYSGNHELYEKALYKASLCFKLSGKMDEYKTYYDKLVESFPQSKYIAEFK
jgi:TolA-binding protein